jgi:hypothetical protein
VLQWDIDRYEHLQDSAWELELLANKQERSVDGEAGREKSEISRTSASDLRREAAYLLTQYWAPRTPATR